MPERSRLSQHLAEQLEACRGRPELAAFWAVFDREQIRAAEFESFDAACSTADGAVDLMVTALRATREVPVGLPVHDVARLLGPAMMLAAAERHLQHQTGWYEGGSATVVVRLQDALAAAMAAAVAHNAGLRLVRSDLDDQRLEVANVVRATDISVLGIATTRDQAVAALLAASDSGMDPGFSERRKAALARVNAHGLPDPAFLRAELRALSREEKVRLMFMLQPDAQGQVDEGLIDFLGSECGVPAWVHQPPAAANAAERSRLQSIQASLLRYVQGVHDALQPVSDAPTIAAGTKPLVFVSYAHADDKPVAPASQSHAQSLRLALKAHSRGDGPVEFFFDVDHIETGDRWHEKIQTAVEQCRVAVVMVSNAFFASDYICEHELPRFRDRYLSGDLLVLPVQTRTCVVPQQAYAAWLSLLQQQTGIALTGLGEHDVNLAITKLVDQAVRHCAQAPTS